MSSLINIMVGVWATVLASGVFIWVWTAKAQQVPHLNVLSWAGSIMTVLGVALLAGNIGLEGAGFMVGLVGSVVWMVYGLEVRTPALWVLQLFLIGFDVLGVWRWIS